MSDWSSIDKLERYCGYLFCDVRETFSVLRICQKRWRFLSQLFVALCGLLVPNFGLPCTCIYGVWHDESRLQIVHVHVHITTWTVSPRRIMQHVLCTAHPQPLCQWLPLSPVFPVQTSHCSATRASRLVHHHNHFQRHHHHHHHHHHQDRHCRHCHQTQGVSFASLYASGAWNFEVAPRFLENLCSRNCYYVLSPSAIFFSLVTGFAK